MEIISKIKAAILLLKIKKRPLHTNEIINLAIKKNLIRTKGKTPAATLNADILNENKRRKLKNLKPRFVKTAPKTWKYNYED